MARVVIEDHFAEFGLEFDEAMKRALIQAAAVTKAEAERTVPKGETGKLESSIHLSEIDSTTTGWRIAVYAGEFYGKFLEFGTLGSRKRKLRRPNARRETSSPGSGIKPRYFMLNAGRATESALGEAMAEEIAKL